MDIKISCIIPYYNVKEEWLLQCINSILQQDFQEYEIIIVDDGSDAPHAAYLEKILLLDHRIRIITQHNQGVSAARNAGLRQAKGEYIVFVDSDDVVVPFYFSEAYRIATENHADYVIGGSILTSSVDITVPYKEHPVIEARDSAQYRPSIIAITDNIQGGGHLGRGPVARLVKKSLLDQVFFSENMSIFEDIIWNFDVASKCDRIYTVHQIWYLYRGNPGSATHKYNDQSIQICESFLHNVIPRIDLKNEKEASAYCSLVFELLSRYVYRNYLGHAQCPLPRRERRQAFHELCRQEPWTLYQTDLFLKTCDRRTRIKHFLIRSGLLYGFCSIRKLFGRD
ncbi:MAG: glycosyltransferase [Bacteroidales bacterium]|nr:glycosyltransferase [Bacteroidales bacterium]